MKTEKRKCSECKLVLSVSAFPETSEGKPGNRCIECCGKYNDQWHERRPGSFVRVDEGVFERKRKDRR